MYILVKYGIQCPFTSNSSCEAMDGTAHKKSFQRRTGLSKVLILYFNIYFIVFYQFKLFVFWRKFEFLELICDKDIRVIDIFLHWDLQIY